MTGAAPVVDTQSIRQQQTMNSTELDALPSGNIGLQTLAYVTPGFATTQADVGGTRDTWSAQGAYTFYHGKTGTRASFDGFRNQYFIGAASGVGYITDSGTIEEMQLETSGMGAESGSGSTNLNAIPKSGSNTLRATRRRLLLERRRCRADNLNDYLALVQHQLGRRGRRHLPDRRAARRPDHAGQGVVLRRDRADGARASTSPARTSTRCRASAMQRHRTLFYPGQPGTPYANASYDTSRPAAGFDWYRTHSLRMTWQVAERHRIGFFGDIQKSCRCTTGPFTGANAIESERGWDWWPSGVVQGTWTAPLTSRLLLEAGLSWQTANWVNFAETGVTRDDRSILELSTNYRYGATPFLTAPNARTGRSRQRFSLSYVTGTHNLKVGITDEQGFNDESRSCNNPDGLNYDFLNGRPVRLQYLAMPFFQQERQNHEIGVFAQDAWTLGRFTLNLGLRWDYITMGFPAADLPAGPYVPARHVDALSGVPKWSDINPRVGASIDVFGNGRTAVKVSIGPVQPVEPQRHDAAVPPVQLVGQHGVPRLERLRDVGERGIRALPGRRSPRRQLHAGLRRGQLAAERRMRSDKHAGGQFFGQFIPLATLYDDAVIKDNRDYLWDFVAQVQHEVTRGLSVSFGYNRNWDGTFQVTDNLAARPERLRRVLHHDPDRLAPAERRAGTVRSYDIKRVARRDRREPRDDLR